MFSQPPFERVKEVQDRYTPWRIKWYKTQQDTRIDDMEKGMKCKQCKVIIDIYDDVWYYCLKCYHAKCFDCYTDDKLNNMDEEGQCDFEQQLWDHDDEKMDYSESIYNSIHDESKQKKELHIHKVDCLKYDTQHSMCEQNSFDQASIVMLETIKIKHQRENSSFLSRYVKDIKSAFRPIQFKSKIEAEQQNQIKSNEDNFKDSKVKRHDFNVFQIHKKIDNSLQSGYHCPLHELLDVRLQRVHPMDAYSISLEKQNKIQAMDNGLSFGITETYIEETDMQKDVLRKKKLIQKKKKRKDSTIAQSPGIQLTNQSTDKIR